MLEAGRNARKKRQTPKEKRPRPPEEDRESREREEMTIGRIARTREAWRSRGTGRVAESPTDERQAAYRNRSPRAACGSAAVRRRAVLEVEDPARPETRNPEDPPVTPKRRMSGSRSPASARPRRQ
jgi:hypothetical protein